MTTSDTIATPSTLSTSSMPSTLGQLADETPDVMTLHTHDAFRMFAGRSANAQTQVVFVAGGRQFAAVLKSIWYLSANDNPYADWILIRVYHSLGTIRAQMAQAVGAREAEFDALRRKGLNLSVLRSRSPATVALGFRSPYGYATAEVIVEFDYYVRMVKTLVQKDRLSDDDGRTAIREIGRGLRALFLEAMRWERLLLREEMLHLSRRDFLPSADEVGRQRMHIAVTLFGEVPRTVFTGDEAPRHSQRRVTPTAADLHLLRQVALSIHAQAEPAEPLVGELL